MDKKPLIFKGMQIAPTYKQQIADLERRLEEAETLIADQRRNVAFHQKENEQLRAEIADLRDLWLDAVWQKEIAESFHRVAVSERTQVIHENEQLAELKENNGLNRAEVEVERLLKVVAEKDAEIERLKNHECIKLREDW